MKAVMNSNSQQNQLELGYNLLQDAKIEVIGNMGGMKAEKEKLSSEALFDYLGTERLKLLASDSDFERHIDFYADEFSVIYDLGKETEFDSFFLKAFHQPFEIGRFEVFFSDTREDLFNSDNRVIAVNNENDCCKKNKHKPFVNFFFEIEDGKARYIAFRQLSTNDAEDISRITVLGLYSKAVSEQRYYLMKNNFKDNLISNILLSGGGNASALTDGVIFNKMHSCTVSGKAELVIRESDGADKIVIIGDRDVKPKVFVSEASGKPYEITAEERFEYAEIEHGRIKTEISLNCDCKIGCVGLDFGEECAVIEHFGVYRSSYKLDLNTNDCLNNDFIGFGVNTLPMHLFPGTRNLGYDNACFEIEKCRLLKLRAQVVRMWFQPDWFIMDENDYYNRRYVFNSTYMRGVYKELEAYMRAGTAVELNFGWKTSIDAQEWMVSEDIETRGGGAPKDLKQFAVALSDLLQELIVKRKFTNIKYITFFNEPESSAGENGYDFVVPDYKPIEYWKEMLRLCDAQLRKDGIRDLVEIWGAENSGLLTEEYAEKVLTPWNEGLAENKGRCNRISQHYYGGNYEQIFKSLEKTKKLVPEMDICVTEFNANDHTFDKNNVSVALALMNGGASAGLYWYLSGCFLEGGFLFDGGMWGIPLEDYAGINSVSKDFLRISLLGNYAPAGSKVLKIENNYSDLHMAAVVTAEGDISVFAETDDSAFDKKIDLRFLNSVNKIFYRHTFTLNTPVDGNAVVPVCDKKLYVENELSDIISPEYSFTVYSTIKPIKQVVMDELNVTVKPGETCRLSARVIDGDESDKLRWSICDCYYPFKYIGEITEDGIYTAGPQISNRRLFRRVAVKAETPTGEYGICFVNTVT